MAIGREGALPFYLADDQRADEAYSLTFTTTPLDREVRILGWPKVVLHASSSAEIATFVVKLADVAPDGHSALIVDGSLNGTRRQSLTDPSPMRPGEVYELNIPMWPTGWVIKPGHRLRVAISGADFPNLGRRHCRRETGSIGARLTLPASCCLLRPNPSWRRPSFFLLRSSSSW